MIYVCTSTNYLDELQYAEAPISAGLGFTEYSPTEDVHKSDFNTRIN